MTVRSLLELRQAQYKLVNILQYTIENCFKELTECR
jgi:hypothetical protein